MQTPFDGFQTRLQDSMQGKFMQKNSEDQQAGYGQSPPRDDAASWTVRLGLKKPANDLVKVAELKFRSTAQTTSGCSSNFKII